MRASPLHGTSVPAGRLTLWHPTTATRQAAATAPTDPRPLTADQSAHLASVPLAERGTLDPTPWIGLSCLLRDATTATIPAMVARYFDRHESLRSVYHQTDDDSFERCLLAPGLVDFEPHLVGDFDSADNLRHVANHLAKEARCARWPYAGFATIEGDHGTMWFAGFDHVVFDGYSMYVSMDEFPRLHADIVQNRPTPPPALSHIDYAALEQAATENASPSASTLEPWRSSLDPQRRLRGLPSATGLTPGEAWEHGFVSLPILAATESTAVTRILNAEGRSVGLNFLAAAVAAAAALEPDGRLDFLMSMHNRPDEAWAEAIGWFAGVAPMTVELSESFDLESVAATLTSTWTRAQAAGSLRMPVVSELLRAKIEPGLVLSFMDGHRVPGWEKWPHTQARPLLGPTPASTQIHIWINCMPDGTHVEARYPIRPQCAIWIAKVATAMRESLLALCSKPTPQQEIHSCK